MAEQQKPNEHLTFLKNELNTALQMLEALSFVRVTQVNFTSTAARPCKCSNKRTPYIVPSAYTKGKWIAICPDCVARTEEQTTPVRAVKAWNEGERTEMSRMCEDRLTVDKISSDGMKNLVAAISDRAVEDLMWAEEHDTLDSPAADEARRWIRNKEVIKDIESGDRRRRREYEAMLAKARKEKKKAAM